ncbi:MAG: 50S ribosomal protein L13 [Deltaproteobacteria bacterium]|nr:50S ribosomal protein L13 [Deltaproteobacteria bacterium]MBW2311074.1 50S ribosomal protein L13 [Deltaproteobacteria bacterium]RLB30402.1 MAG: 50S ribosomal protein L13 [Deltaproteobacteria bacterium]
MKTFVAKEHEVDKKWYLVDASNKILGRLASEIATILRGKHKAIFTSHMDAGDYVIVVNADKVALTGGKLDKKAYYRHSGYVGGLKKTTARQLFEKKPEDLIRLAVKGMLPKTSLGRRQLTKLKIYAGPNHPHQAQQPVNLES